VIDLQGDLSLAVKVDYYLICNFTRLNIKKNSILILFKICINIRINIE